MRRIALRHHRLLAAVVMLLLCSSVNASTFDVPFNERDWVQLQYDGIPANRVTLDGRVMQISVNGSASPLIYALQQPLTVGRFRIKATVSGAIDLPPGISQASEEVDDFRLRAGLVYSGEKQLNFMQRLVAPDWIKSVFDLAPKNQGISRVEFFGTWRDPALAGKDIVHPETDLWKQHFVLEVTDQGVIDQTVDVPTDEKVVALWISSDGDATGSQLEVRIEQLQLHAIGE